MLGPFTKMLRTVIYVKFEMFVDAGIQAVCISYTVCNLRQENGVEIHIFHC